MENMVLKHPDSLKKEINICESQKKLVSELTHRISSGNVSTVNHYVLH